MPDQIMLILISSMRLTKYDPALACNELFSAGKFSFFELQYALLLIGQMIARIAAHNCTSKDVENLRIIASMKHISCQVLTEQIAGLTNNRFLTGLFQSLVQVATANVKEERHSYTISMQFNTKGLELIEAIAQRDENMAEMAMSQMLRSYFDDR